MTFTLYRVTETDCLPIALAPENGAYIVGLWRDGAGDWLGRECAWSPAGWRDRSGTPLNPTHFLPAPRFP